MVAGSACVGGAAGAACALPADAAGCSCCSCRFWCCWCCRCWWSFGCWLGSAMVLVLLLVHAGTGSSAGAAGFKLLNTNPVSVALFGAQQADSQQGCWTAQYATTPTYAVPWGSAIKNHTFGIESPTCAMHRSLVPSLYGWLVARVPGAEWELFHCDLCCQILVHVHCAFELWHLCAFPQLMHCASNNFYVLHKLCWSTLYHWEVPLRTLYILFDWMSYCPECSGDISYVSCTLLIYAVPWGSGINHPIFWIERPTVRTVPLTFRMFFDLCWSTLPLGNGIKNLTFCVECPTVRNVSLTFHIFFELCWSTLCHWEVALGFLLFGLNVPLCAMHRSLFMFFLNFAEMPVPMGICFLLLWLSLGCFDFPEMPVPMGCFDFTWVALT